MSRGRWMRVLVVAVLAALLAACGDDGGTLQWRDATLEVPDGWHVFEEEDTRLSIGNVPLGEDAGEPEDREGVDVLAMLFTHRPGLIPQDWREFVEEREHAVLESDDAIELDGVPATRIVYRESPPHGQPTREMVVVIPAREIEVLAQPVTEPGDEDAPEVFLDNLETFLGVLDSIEWGAPVD